MSNEALPDGVEGVDGVSCLPGPRTLLIPTPAGTYKAGWSPDDLPKQEQEQERPTNPYPGDFAARLDRIEALLRDHGWE